MKTPILMLVCCYFFGMVTGIAQSVSVKFLLYNELTKQPIDDAHAFLVNTTYGTTSNGLGQIELMLPKDIQEDLLITHIAYDTRLVEAKMYHAFSGDTLFLIPNQLDISEVTVQAKRSKKWKKRFKKFQKAFLGNDKAADKCTILNPEVLRFEENDGQLKVTAIDLLHLDNRYLGYNIYYLLNYLTIEADGSTAYLGKAQFVDDRKGSTEKQIQKNRQQVFLQSPKHFFNSLINNRLEAEKYETTIAALKNNQFNTLQTPSLNKLLKKTPDGQTYHLYFTDFLKIINRNIKVIDYDQVGVRTGGLESQKFNYSQREEKTILDYATSYLYKTAPYLILNKFGNVLNTKQVKEYGYWADQRMAQELPFDYGNDYGTIEQKPVVTETTPVTATAQPLTIETSSQEKLKLLLSLIYEQDQRTKNQTLEELSTNWQADYIPPLIEILRLSTDQWLIKRINLLLQTKTGQKELQDYFDWLEWLWEQEAVYGDYFSDFKAEYYQHVDPKFRQYFKDQQATATISLDEILWGGVKQDGIPPLRQPKLLAASDATYLNDKDVVFGIFLNGEARAYPKRILAWHEFFVDTFDSTSVAGVYCTLCGTVIAYDMTYKGTLHQLGTSGFLYRSNKLMYDKATQSLWNTIEGKPVVGPLANKGISLKSYAVVSTTWGAWKKMHPSTKVLSLDTGYDRDYGEGVAYQTYFATDALMFPVPQLDQRLDNKAEVFIVRAKGYQKNPIAISMKYLRKKKWYQGIIGDTFFVVISDKSGAARAYNTKAIRFDSYKKGQLVDEQGKLWQVTEEYLLASNGQRLKRLPAHSIFWFAWFNSYPMTRLVK